MVWECAEEDCGLYREKYVEDEAVRYEEKRKAMQVFGETEELKQRRRVITIFLSFYHFYICLSILLFFFY